MRYSLLITLHGNGKHIKRYESLRENVKIEYDDLPTN